MTTKHIATLAALIVAAAIVMTIVFIAALPDVRERQAALAVRNIATMQGRSPDAAEARFREIETHVRRD